MRALARFGPRILLAALGGLALAGEPASAQIVQINELRPLRPDATVDIGVVAHSITVEGWDRNEIQITGSYDSDREELEISGTESVFSFQIDSRNRPFRGPGGRSSHLDIRLPRGARLSVESVSGSLDLGELSGTLRASSVSGGVDVTANLTSSTLSSVSGSIRYVGNSPTVRLEAVSGGVTFEGKGREVRLEAVSGSVTLEGEADAIEAKSVSGAIRIRSAIPVRSLDASSVSGTIRFGGRLASGGRISAESHSGAVELALGSGSDARFELSSFSGNVNASLAGMRDENRIGSRRRPNQSFTFVTGSGTGRVTASSFSGTVRILEQPGSP